MFLYLLQIFVTGTRSKTNSRRTCPGGYKCASKVRGRHTVQQAGVQPHSHQGKNSTQHNYHLQFTRFDDSISFVLLIYFVTL